MASDDAIYLNLDDINAGKKEAPVYRRKDSGEFYKSGEIIKKRKRSGRHRGHGRNDYIIRKRKEEAERKAREEAEKQKEIKQQEVFRQQQKAQTKTYYGGVYLNIEDINKKEAPIYRRVYNRNLEDTGEFKKVDSKIISGRWTYINEKEKRPKPPSVEEYNPESFKPEKRKPLMSVGGAVKTILTGQTLGSVKGEVQKFGSAGSYDPEISDVFYRLYEPLSYTGKQLGETKVYIPSFQTITPETKTGFKEKTLFQLEREANQFKTKKTYDQSLYERSGKSIAKGLAIGSELVTYSVLEGALNPAKPLKAIDIEALKGLSKKEIKIVSKEVIKTEGGSVIMGVGKRRYYNAEETIEFLIPSFKQSEKKVSVAGARIFRNVKLDSAYKRQQAFFDESVINFKEKLSGTAKLKGKKTNIIKEISFGKDFTIGKKTPSAKVYGRADFVSKGLKIESYVADESKRSIKSRLKSYVGVIGKPFGKKDFDFGLGYLKRKYTKSKDKLIRFSSQLASGKLPNIKLFEETTKTKKVITELKPKENIIKTSPISSLIFEKGGAYGFVSGRINKVRITRENVIAKAPVESKGFVIKYKGKTTPELQVLEENLFGNLEKPTKKRGGIIKIYDIEQKNKLNQEEKLRQLGTEIKNKGESQYLTQKQIPESIYSSSLIGKVPELKFKTTSEYKILAKPRFKQKTKTIQEEVLNQEQTQSTIQKQNQRFKQKTIQKEKTRFKTIDIISNAQKNIPSQDIKLVKKVKLKSKQKSEGNVPPTIISNPNPIRPEEQIYIKKPEIPTFQPSLRRVRKVRKLRGNIKRGYVPSFTALVFKIRGKKPSGLKTGISFRPITPEFSFFKKKRIKLIKKVRLK